MKIRDPKVMAGRLTGLISLIAIVTSVIGAEGDISGPTSPPGWNTAPSGLQYQILAPGQGIHATTGKFVTVHFKGKLQNGIVFSNSSDQGIPFEFKLGNSNVPAGVNEGIGLLKEGGKARLTIPPSLGYGNKGAPGVPPNATMEFDIELIKVSDVPAPPAVPVAQPALTLANFRSSPALNSVIDLRSPNISSIQLAIALVTNEIRKENGRSELVFSPQLVNAAQMHADDMKEHQFFSHQNNRDRSKSDPQKRAGMHGVANPNISENITQGFGIRYSPNSSVRPLGGGGFADMQGRKLTPHSPLSLADSLLATWMASPGHKTNILDPTANSIGCGISFYNNPDFHQMPSVYAVQNFQRGQPIRVGAKTRL